MKNESAFPKLNHQNQHTDSFEYRSDFEYSSLGLTKREYFAALALQGLLADSTLQSFPYSRFAQSAVELADALINELEKTNADKD